jgi:hypothetical protein
MRTSQKRLEGSKHRDLGDWFQGYVIDGESEEFGSRSLSNRATVPPYSTGPV